MMYQCQIEIGREFPIQLVLLSNGTLAFVRVTEFKAVIDQPEVPGSVSAVFDLNGFTLLTDEGYEEFDYNTTYDYKNIPAMLKWLQQQNLIEPTLINVAL